MFRAACVKYASKLPKFELLVRNSTFVSIIIIIRMIILRVLVYAILFQSNS